MIAVKTNSGFVRVLLIAALLLGCFAAGFLTRQLRAAEPPPDNPATGPAAGIAVWPLVAWTAWPVL